MHVLVVHAHPDTESFSRAVRDRALEGLGRAGHEVTVIDLYEEGFRPAMSREERLAYHEHPILDEHVARHADLVRRSEALVFVYPTWWWGMPAILKGWLERVMVLDVAFAFNPSSGRIQPRLRHLRRIVGISTYGSSRMYMRLFNDGGRRTIRRCLGVLSDPRRCRHRWLALYGMDRSSASDREAFLDRVQNAMERL